MSKRENKLNRFFNKIFVISLYDNDTRWKSVEKQFKSRGIKAERFIAVDGRCKKTRQDCIDKLKSFEYAYDVKIPIKKGQKVEKILPAASLTIGTILLLRAMVRHKWKYMLICEDDILLSRGLEEKFKKGIKEIGKRKWDVLYLGCGKKCGIKGIGEKKTSKLTHISPWNEIGDMEDEVYVAERNDLRLMCDETDCTPISDHISVAHAAGGTWCYAYSLTGARKMLKLLDDNANNHIDQLLIKHMLAGKMKALAFDPPIVYHEDLRQGRKTNIPW